MTPSEGVTPREGPSDSPGELTTLSGEVTRLARIIVTVQGCETAVRLELRSLAARLSKLERQSRAWTGPGSQKPWPARPAPVDPENPTDGEIRDHILNQLYQTGCWNGKHTSGLHLARGYLDRVERRRVERVIKELRSQGILLAHGKSPDEHFSLNPEQASWVYRLLGIPERGGGEAPRTTQWRPAPDTREGALDRGASTEYVGVGQFENSIRSIRSTLEQDGRALGHLGQQLEQSIRKLAEVSAHIEGRLTDLGHRLEVLERQSFVQPTVSATQPDIIERGHVSIEGGGK